MILPVTTVLAYTIYDLSSDRELVIVRALHHARDAAAIADQGGFKPGYRLWHKGINGARPNRFLHRRRCSGAA